MNTKQPRRHVAALLALLLASTAQAQYGDAYHAPDRLKLQQMAGQRARQQADEHSARIRDASSRPKAAPVMNFGSGTSWADSSGMEAQREAGARMEAREQAFQAKLKRMETLIAQRGLQRRAQDHAGLVSAALDAGHDAYWASRTFGTNPADYADRLAREQQKATARAFSGSTRASCQDGCSETLRVAGGHHYDGQTLNGLPQGTGTLVYADGGTLQAQWAAGRASGPIRLQYANGDAYEGGFDGDRFSGTGRYTYKSGSVDSGRYAAGELDGPAERLIIGSEGSREFSRGRYKTGVPVGVHESTFENSKRKRIVEDFDNPAASRAEWVDGKVFVGVMKNGVPVSGTLTYASGMSFAGLFHANGAPRAGLFTGANGASQYGNFSDAAKRHGYVALSYADGSTAEIMHSHNAWAGPILRTQPNGDVLSGVTTRPGFLVWGVLRHSGGDAAAARPAALTEQGQLVMLPESDHAAAREAARASAEVITTERERLRQLLGA
ncbi:hypothetical protein ACG02S_04255 [Roseateles sp. DC23W]|uniref:MORN repeat-containing protein n=1 Tax=Pelomonas dachongensis TaxID=3299029 RepID=A0ABW7EI91_9BURK